MATLHRCEEGSEAREDPPREALSECGGKSDATPLSVRMPGRREERRSRDAAALPLLVLVLDARHALHRATGPQPSVHERVDIAVHDALDVARLHASRRSFTMRYGWKT